VALGDDAQDFLFPLDCIHEVKMTLGETALTIWLRAKMAWLIGHQVEKATLTLIDLVHSSATLAEAAGVGLMVSLGAKQQIKEFDDLKGQLDQIIEMLRQLRVQRSTPKE